MSRSRVVMLVLGLCFLAVSLTGCDLLDRLLGGGSTPGPGGGNNPTAVITYELDDDIVAMGLNPDMRPPLRYRFSASSSLDRDGESMMHTYMSHEFSWDFDNGTTYPPSIGYKTPPSIVFYREGTYDVTLTVTDSEGGTDTAIQTMTIGEPWLEIMDVSTTLRQDGRYDISVSVRNQSTQDLRDLEVQWRVDGVITGNLGVTLWQGDPDRLVPNAGYILRGTIGAWTGELTVNSSWCTPYGP